MNRIRRLFSLGALALALTACASGPGTPSLAAMPPIVFVHGNGDSAATWQAQVWRFESQGWPRERLLAIDQPLPNARDDDGVAQPGRSSSAEHMQFLAGEIDRLLARTGASQVALVGNSRGGNAIRNYLANHPGAAAKVSQAVLGGTPNHGVWIDPKFRPGSEFNGAGVFLSTLNAPKGPNGDEVTPGPRWLTLRSDGNDLYAQPDGAAFGAKGMATGVTAAGPALQGATNLVLAGQDHREVSYGALAFARTFEFITGRAPQGTAIQAEAQPVLNGKINAPSTNMPLSGAQLQVWAVDAQTGERLGSEPRHSKTIAADGLWGPFKAEAGTSYEFVISAPGLASTHVYRAPFPRSSELIHFRPERLLDADRSAASVLTFARPRGYFGLPRDRVSLDGKPPEGLQPGVASVSRLKLKLSEGAGRAVEAVFNDQRLVGRAWPAPEHVVVLELTD